MARRIVAIILALIVMVIGFLLGFNTELKCYVLGISSGLFISAWIPDEK
ncbi:hypothetical protein [Brochothrix phage ADU4]|nr:hypothetical protein [Brochothrix phage ADU4]